MLDLPESKENNETINTYLRIISDENKRLKGLVELVLQQAKMTDKTIAFQKKEINIHEVITNAEENISFIMKRKGGNIQMDFQAKDPIIFADNLHITNLIYNLLDNAVKYSPKLLDIKISTYDSEKELHIVVSDKGIGIDKSKIKHIFDKFYRIPTGNIHNIKGFGIGLSYVKQIVDLHKGKINVTSEVNKGTTFDITIPRH
jgi:two-component system phosphate regulon sensor histidine kinase PhoR